MKIPLVDLKAQYLSLKPEIDSAIFSALENSEFIGGPLVDNFEKSFASLYGAGNCISVANGTDSLFIIMKMLGIGPGDEVITVANSWISSSETITQTGARVVFVDADPVYYTIDEKILEEKITPKTKAIIPVHIFGQMCDIETIIAIGLKHNIPIIEDCAQSHFSTFKGKNAGLFGTASSFSFYPGKNLGAYGDAGCIITNDSDLAVKFKMYARHGALKKHSHMIEGINSRMDSLQAAVLTVKLRRILEWTKQRQEKAKFYSRGLANVGDLILPAVRENSEHSFHLYVVQTDKRDELAAFLETNNIQTAQHYPTPLPFLKAYEYLNHNKSDFPISDHLSRRILSLPLYPELTSEQQGYIIDKIEIFYNQQ